MARPQKDFSEVFDALRKLLKPLQAQLVTQIDKPGHLYLDAPTNGPNGQPLFFGGVRTGTSYVSFHLMPVYVNPALLEGVSPELMKRMQGKSCFNFTRPEYTLFRELDALVKAGLEDYRASGKLG